MADVFGQGEKRQPPVVVESETVSALRQKRPQNILAEFAVALILITGVVSIPPPIRFQRKKANWCNFRAYMHHILDQLVVMVKVDLFEISRFFQALKAQIFKNSQFS